MRRAERIFAAALGVAMLAAIASPALRSPPVDGFPLSNYPMFSRARDTDAVRIGHVVAFDEHGGGRPVVPRLLGSLEVMQARQTVFIAVRQGRRAAEDLCRAAAEQVADAGGAWTDAVRLEVRVDYYDAIAYFEGQTQAIASEVHASCPVGGRS